MEFLDFVYIAASVDAGNFTKAAKSLGLNTSTVTRRISRLEDELGLSLFERGRTGARLTAGGKAMMPHVRRALAEIDAVRSVGHRNGVGSVGEIRLGVRTPPVGEPVGGEAKNSRAGILMHSRRPEDNILPIGTFMWTYGPNR